MKGKLGHSPGLWNSSDSGLKTCVEEDDIYALE